LATAVQIELMVDEKGAVQGVRSFDTAIKGTAGTTSQLDATLKQLNGTLNKTAAAGVNAGRASGRAMHQVKEDGMSAKEGLHLVTEELDLHIPRAFRSLIAESKLAQSAISALGGAIAGIGLAQVGFMVLSQLAEGAQKLYEKYLDVDGAIERFNREAGEAASKKFYEDSGLDQLKEDLVGVNDQLDELKKKKEAAGRWDVTAGEAGKMLGSSLLSIGTLGAVPYKYSFGVDDAKNQNINQGKQDTSELRILEDAHKKNLQKIEDEQRIAEAKAAGIGKARAAQEAENRKAQEDYEYRVARARKLAEIVNRGVEENNKTWYGGHLKPGDEKYRESVKVSPNAGVAERDDARMHAGNEFKAAQIEEQRATSQEIRKLQDETRQAELGGIALLEDQRAAADREWVIEHGKSAAAIKAIDEKFYAEERKLIEEQRRETEKFVGRAALSQFTGVAKLQQQSVLDIADIRGDKNLDDTAKDQRAAAVKEKLAADIAELQKQYIQQTDELERDAQARSLTGLARIRAEAERTIAAKELAFKTQWGQVSPDSAEYQKAHQQLNRQKTIITGSADQQSQEYLRHSLEETEQMEAEAHVKMLSAEKQQTAAIALEYEQRTRKFREELDQQLTSGKLSLSDMNALQEDYNRKVAAAAEQRDAQLVEAARQAREKMAGEFTRFFRDPMGAMKEMGQKAAGEMAARMFQQVESRHGGAPGQQQGFSDQWSLGKIFDHVPGLGGRNAQNVQNGESEKHRSETLASGAFTLAHAEIRVAMANISMPALAGGITPGAPGATASGAALSSGSTSLLGMPGTFGEGGSTTALARVSGPQGMGGSPTFSGSTESGGGANPFGTALSDIKQGVGVFKQAKSIFGSPKSTIANGGGDDETLGGGGMLDINKVFGSSTTKVTGPSGSGGGMLGGGGMMANLGGAAGGAMGLFSAYQGNGGLGGALGGAMSGMELGMAVGGPIGAAVGLVGGAILGAIGFGGREKARVYDLKTVRPRLGDDFHSFQTGAMDYTSAYSDMQSLDTEARKTLGKMGGSAKAYYWDTINKEIHQAEAKLTAEEKAGRSGQTMSAAQYHQGGWTGGFGSMATGPDSGWAHMREGEFVVHEQAAVTHAGALEAIRAGASHSDMARYYGLDSSAQGYRMAMQPSGAGGGSGRTQNITVPIQAIDTKDFVQRIHDVKHHVRAAVNSSYAENSGGSDASF
jgi:hypothetical protein